MSAEGGGAGRREVAWRVFAAEFDDADLEYSSSDEERAPNYVVTPTGARINRLFVVGVLTEVEAVSDEVLRGRIVDPTGAFVVYAGQYQPDALAFLESADVPQFVSVTGKARTFQPEDSEQVYTSIRPESINAVDAETRDRWTVQTAEHTLDRVSTFGTALDLTHSGDALREALVAGGVEEGLADGITLALEHYGTTEGYLAAVAGMALDAARVVAGERDEVPPLDVDPDEESDASLDVEYSLTDIDVDTTAIPQPDELEAAAAESGEDVEAEASGASESETESDDELGDFEPEETDVEETEAADETEPAEVEDAADAAEVQPTDEVGDPEVEPAEESVPDEQFEPEPDETDLGTGDVGDEMYELDEEERREVEEEFGTEFSTGAELDQESDEAPEPEAEAEEGEAEAAEAEETGDATEAESAAGEAEAESAEVEEETEAERAEEAGEPDEPEEAEEAAGEEGEPDEEAEAEEAETEEAETAEEPDDLEAVVVETMRDLDEGDGANRDELVAEVTSAYDVSADDVEEAIQDALMSGQCYEADEETLKPI